PRRPRGGGGVLRLRVRLRLPGRVPGRGRQEVGDGHLRRPGPAARTALPRRLRLLQGPPPGPLRAAHDPRRPGEDARLAKEAAGREYASPGRNGLGLPGSCYPASPRLRRVARAAFSANSCANTLMSPASGLNVVALA